jgi:hypothetical protein
MDMDTASPPVSPKVVAAILMIQKTSVTSGTLDELSVGSFSTGSSSSLSIGPAFYPWYHA